MLPPPLPHPGPVSLYLAHLSQVKIEHTDLGGSFVKPQSAKDVEVALEHCERGGGVVLSVGLKPRPVSRVAAATCTRVCRGQELRSMLHGQAWHSPRQFRCPT